MARLFILVLLASSALAVKLQGTPKMISGLQKIKPWSGDVQNVPDGKMFMMRKDVSDKSKGFIINTTPNNFASSTSSSVDDITGPYNDPDLATKYPQAQANFVPLAAKDPIPSAEETGMRGNGSLYDENTLWIFNAFRLRATSQPSASSDELIGFEHNEDYWQNAGGGECTYKSIAVRYSPDLGKSWTRSVPIVTKGIQNATCDENHQFTGTGDFATMWNPLKKEWIIIAQEGPLVMSRSSDPLAKPGTWTRVDPATGKTQPGFIGADDGSTLTHGDLESIAGSNPSIIFDQGGKNWHMVYAKWGGGIAYTSSRDLYRWSKPTLIWEDSSAGGIAPGSKYPTLVGDEGDTLTTTGSVELYFTADNQIEWGRPLWAVGLQLSGVASNSTSTGTGAGAASGTLIPITPTSTNVGSSAGDDEEVDECETS